MAYVGIVLALALVFGLGLLYVTHKMTSAGTKSSGLDKKIVQNKWREIEMSIGQGGPANFQSAVMEADKLFDYVLKGIVGNNNQNMGERLKIAQKKFSSWDVYQGIWAAHKVRNRMAHEMNHELNSAVARNAIEQFRKGLRDLGLL
ncbi:hypothetical protein COY62_02130 [bacterium (Candidatus Howlettbacteria) CG_4_10_14_0_8_um_filter_40_9]|nr:MAG: hypothetical protein COY62_02130 [bacterium (Candidatus Howlettbacteria) CG_4_10_14_0_8_um_filter_40_9]